MLKRRANNKHTMELAGYETLELLGSGQYGDVFLVRRITDQQLFAAKVGRRTMGGPSEAQSAAAALQEAELLASLRHANIVQCTDVVLQGSQLTIVMEYAAGGDLDGFLQMNSQRSAPHNVDNCVEQGCYCELCSSRRGQPLSEPVIMRFFIQTAIALAYLHGRHVIHRCSMVVLHGVLKLC